jgi:Ras-related protein Rab-21
MGEAINHYKVVLLGEGRVGKTSILSRYVDNKYDSKSPSTLQASYLEKHVIIENETNRRYCNHEPNQSRREAYLSIWDTAGQERFHSLGPIYYRDARGAVLVYDITDRSSFDRVRKWNKELRKIVGESDKICIIIVGNKIDLQHQRAVDEDEVRNYANSVGASFMEVSAKTGMGVENAFVELTMRMLDTVKPSHRSRSSLASASGVMANSITNNQDDLVDLSIQQNQEKEVSKCC